MGNEHFEYAREHLSNIVMNALEAHDDVLMYWERNEHVGPLGGVSEKIEGFVEVDDNVVAPFIINIYSDDRVDARLSAVLEAEEKKHNLKKRIKKLRKRS